MVVYVASFYDGNINVNLIWFTHVGLALRAGPRSRLTDNMWVGYKLSFRQIKLNCRIE